MFRCGELFFKVNSNYEMRFFMAITELARLVEIQACYLKNLFSANSVDNKVLTKSVKRDAETHHGSNSLTRYLTCLYWWRTVYRAVS